MRNFLFGRRSVNAIARILIIWIVACVALAAADFWDEKDFTGWSDAEVEKLLTDSPWSRKVTIALRRPETGGRGRGGGFRGGPGGFGGGAADGFRGAGGGRRGADVFDPAPRRMTFTVSWRSALPVKQALVRTQLGLDAPIPREHQQFLTQLEPFYVVVVSGLPRQFARMAQNRNALIAETILKRQDRNPISPEDLVVFVENGETVTLQYHFPRDDEITLEDKNVEFITNLGQVEAKQEFKLEDMVFAEQLAL